MNASATGSLPAGFAELERFLPQWGVATMAERHRRRTSSTAEQRHDFYAAMSPRLDEAVSYLNQFPLDRLPPDAGRLMQLTLSLMEVTMTQEIYDAKVEAVHALSSRTVRMVQEPDGL